MIGNYFKTAFRSLTRNKGFTFLNIIGLAIGLAVCLLIVFYVIDEISYDTGTIPKEKEYTGLTPTSS